LVKRLKLHHLGNAVPLTPRSPDEQVDLFYRFSTDPKGLGLSVEQMQQLIHPAEWLELYHKWERSRGPTGVPRGPGPAEGRTIVEEEVPQAASGGLIADVGKLEKGDMGLLMDTNNDLKRAVTLDVARRFGGVSLRAIQDAAKNDKLLTEGTRLNRRVLVESLLKYFPPEK
jgi:hypothetical protein